MKKIILFIFNFIALVYLEMLSAFVFFKGINGLSILTILLFLIPVALFNTLLLSIFKEKVNFIIGIILHTFLGIWFSLQLIFKEIFNVFFQVSLFSLGDQVADFKSSAISLILSKSYFILLALIPLIAFIILRKKIHLEKSSFKEILINIIAFLITAIVFVLYTTVAVKNTDYYKIIYKTNNTSQSIKNLGVIHASILDIYKTATKFEEKIEITKKDSSDAKEEKAKEIVYEDNIEQLDFSSGNNSTINNYLLNDIPTKQNEYTNLFKGKNLIYIIAESFHSIGVSKELTPTLYSLINDGYNFKNFYVPNNLSTIGGEFGGLTGLFADNSILKTWRTGNNYFPYGLATKFKNEGYNTYAYHNNSYVFQDRNKYLVSQGFTNFKACFNGLEKLIGCRIWPQSDIEMIDKTVGDYINSDKPFMTYYMTVSGHFAYTFNDNYIATKNRKYVNNLPYSEKVKGYIATQIELDKSLELLIAKLKEKNKLDDTVIVLFADHYPYGLTEKEIAEASTYKRDSELELHHNNLIIWNSLLENKEINKACMSIDVLPTVYNLFGIKYDSRLLMGKDIFSTSEGIAFMKNRTWTTEKGTYYASSNKFYPKQENIEEGYVDYINKTVANRINISKMIVSNNYYKQLFK